MPKLNWRRVDQIYAEASERPSLEQRPFLDVACANEPPEVRTQVETLLQTPHGDEEQFLKQSLAEAARVVAEELFLKEGTRLLDRYTILSILGVGGMGVVYKASADKFDPPLNVAIKLISAEIALAGGPEARARFKAEANAMAQMKDSRFVRVYDTDEWNQQPFLVMELVEGASLESRQEAKISSRDAAELIATLAGAMSHAHALGIVHRDLTPSNILLEGGDRRRPKIADFGLALKLDKAKGATPHGAVIGKPSYMAPEQAAGREAEIDGRTDVYALGAVLYELLTGRPPFRAATTLDILLQVLEQRPEPPRASNPEVDPLLEAICLKCLEKDRDARYPSAEALVADLNRWLRSEPPLRVPVNWWDRLRLWTRRDPVWAALTAAAAALLITSAVLANLGAWYMESKAREAAGESNMRTAEMVADNVLLRLGDLSRSVVETAEDKRVLELMRQSKWAKKPVEMQHYLETDDGHKFQDYIGQKFQKCNRDLKKQGIPEFATWFFLNTDGSLVAPVPRKPKIIGEPFGLRDYFVGAKRYADKNRRKMEAVHISRVFRSRYDNYYKFSIAVPVVDDDGSFLGVLEASIPIHHTLGLRKESLHQKSQKAVLVGRVDRHETPPGYPPVPNYDYHVLLHEAFEERDELRQRELPFTPTTTWPEERDPGLPELRPRPEESIDSDNNFRDPLAVLDPKEFEKYGGRWLAGFARVGNTELIVVVEQWYDDAIGRPVTLAFTFVWSGWAALALFFVLAVTVTGLRGRSRNQPQDG